MLTEKETETVDPVHGLVAEELEELTSGKSDAEKTDADQD